MLSFRGWLYSSFLYLGPGQLVKKRKKHSWNRTRSDLGSKDRPRLYQALNANILTVAEKWSESSCGVLRNSKIIWLSLRKVFLSLRGTNVYIVYLYIYIYILKISDISITWYWNIWLHMMGLFVLLYIEFQDFGFRTYGSPKFIDLDFQRNWRKCKSFNPSTPCRSSYNQYINIIQTSPTKHCQT